MIAIDIAVKRFGGLSKKLKGIIQIASTLALQVAKWLYQNQSEVLDETVLNT